MFLTSIGLFVALIPFVFVRLFRRKLEGFFVVLSALVLIHVCVALITQSLHIFMYPVIMAIHTIVAVGSLFMYTLHRRRISIENINNDMSSNTGKWFVLILAILGLFILYSIRFNYTGAVDTALGVQQVVQSSYTYPLYSDEWIGSSLVQYTIDEKSLPLVNPLDKNSPFINFLMVTHSFFAEVILLLSLDPLTQYVYLAIINSIFLCVAVFVISRLMGVRKVISAISALSVLLITNSGNLPSTWFILPYNLALTFFLFSIIGFLLKNRFILFVQAIVSVAVYPPFILFVVPFLLGISYGKKFDFERIKFFILRIFILFAIALGVVALFSLRKFSFTELFDRAFSFILRESLDNGKVIFDIWNIVPFYILPFIPVGIYLAYVTKKRYILFPVVLGILLWIYYSFTTTVFLIEPSRVIVVTAVLFLLLNSLGMERFYIYAQKRIPLLSDSFIQISLLILLSIFFSFYVLFLPKLGLWHKLPLHVQIDERTYTFIPAPPITRYLHPDDLRLFSGYAKKRFIASPWKGLVIGVSTKNYPLESKSSTLTNRILPYNSFLNASCDEKRKLVAKYKIDLVYSEKIECKDFLIETGTSAEGLILYQTFLRANN